MSGLGCTILTQWCDYSDVPVDSRGKPIAKNPLEDLKLPEPLDTYEFGARASYHTHAMSWPPSTEVLPEKRVPSGMSINAKIFSEDWIKQNKSKFLVGSYENLDGANAHDIIAKLRVRRFDTLADISDDHYISAKIFDRWFFKRSISIYDNFENIGGTERYINYGRTETGTYVPFQLDCSTQVDKSGVLQDVSYTCNCILYYNRIMSSQVFTDADGHDCPVVFLLFMNVDPRLIPSYWKERNG